VRVHPLVEAILRAFSTWGVVIFGASVFVLWLLDAPGRPALYRRACGSALAAAAIGLLANQLIAQAWHRPRPYETHPHGVTRAGAACRSEFPAPRRTKARRAAFKACVSAAVAAQKMYGGRPLAATLAGDPTTDTDGGRNGCLHAQPRPRTALLRPHLDRPRRGRRAAHSSNYQQQVVASIPTP